MADNEDKIVLERDYIVPLRKKWLKSPKYKRVPKAIKALKQFVARHMKIYDKDFKKIKIDRYLNEEIWFRGIKNPPAKIKVKCKKFESGIVKVELAELPEKLKFKKEREEKIEKEVEKKSKEEKEKKEGEKEKTIEEKVEEGKKEEEKEKEKATIENGLKKAEEKAKERKHIAKEKKIKKPLQRKALKK